MYVAPAIIWGSFKTFNVLLGNEFIRNPLTARPSDEFYSGTNKLSYLANHTL